MGSHTTTENLARCGEFTVAFATKNTMVASDFVGIVSAKKNPEKMQKTGWTATRAENVNAPVFTDFPMTLECRILRKIDETEEGYGPTTGTILQSKHGNDETTSHDWRAHSLPIPFALS